MPKKVLIVLQENSGQVALPENIPEQMKAVIFAVIDGLAETFEDIKTTLQGAGRYDVVELLTDTSCRRHRLRDALIAHSRKGRVIDLVILGHGRPEVLALYGRDRLRGGENGNIRSLLTEARARGVQKLNLRMVYMCNCDASTLNDDWIAIGAKASVGARQRDFMPEPMTTFFLQNFLAGQSVADAARNAYQTTIPFWLAIYPPTPKVRYKSVIVEYPCPTLLDPLRICHREIQVPDGVDLIPHPFVKETELVVGGNPNLGF